MIHTSIETHKPAIGWFLLLILIGTILRLILVQRGYNFDIASYRIVADIALKGGNVYAETQRYNYGPIWFYILSFLDILPFPLLDPLLSLRWKISAFLSFIDIAIAVYLYRRYSIKIATFFFLNPVSIIITGYHSQFDNLAILLALLSLHMIEKNAETNHKISLFGLFLLGISLSIKHILFLFPLWLAFKNNRWRDKLVTMTIPYLLFLATFIPYLPEGREGIINHVFLYRSFSNAPFWLGSMPNIIIEKIPLFLLFIGSLSILGLVVRAKKPLDSLLIYTIALLVFSSAIANQYLSICIVGISVHSNAMYLLYSVAATLYLLASGDALHFQFFQHYLGDNGNSAVIGYQELMLLLFMGLLLQLTSKTQQNQQLELLRQSISHLKTEVKKQIKTPW